MHRDVSRLKMIGERTLSNKKNYVLRGLSEDEEITGCR